MAHIVNLTFSDAQSGFINSYATVVASIGPEGEGKTYAGFWGLVKHAQKFAGKMRGAVIRDTFENIKTMTMPSILDASNGLAVFSSGGKKMRFLNADIDLFGIDDLASLSRLQGAEYGFIWLEEPAPIAAKNNAGIMEEVFNIALSRVSRQRGAIPRLQITMNPADEDHWTYRRLVENPINNEFVTTQVFDIPYGANAYRNDLQRNITKEAYKDRPDLYDRYVKGKFSYVQLGEAVTPEYKEETHRSKVKLVPDPKLETFRFWDGGLNPSCVFMQITARGRFYFLDTVVGENMGVTQLIKIKIIPLINKRYPNVKDWRDIGDPSLANREQSDSSKSAAEIINAELGASFEKGESNWQNRRECLKEMFGRNVDGDPMVQISANDTILHRVFRGGWHYNRNNSGNILTDKPEKDIFSHPGDAVSHGIAKILMRPKTIDRLKAMKRNNYRKYGIKTLADIPGTPYQGRGRKVVYLDDKRSINRMFH